MISRRKVGLAALGAAVLPATSWAYGSTTQGEDRHAALDFLDVVYEAVVEELRVYQPLHIENIAQGVVDRLRVKLGIPD